MGSNKTKGRMVGVLFLLVFIMGVLIYQFLQGPVLFEDNFLRTTASHSQPIITSTLLGILSGIISIIIAVLLLPLFKKYNYSLAFLYLAFCILYFSSLIVDNISVLAMLELSKAYLTSETDNAAYLQAIGTVFYETHWWTHYSTLLISCFPVFVLYYNFYYSKLIPKALSIFGLIAVVLMFIEMLSSMLGQGISMNMLMPIGLVQLFLPIWLMIKGFNTSEKTEVA